MNKEEEIYENLIKDLEELNKKYKKRYNNRFEIILGDCKVSKTNALVQIQMFDYAENRSKKCFCNYNKLKNKLEKFNFLEIQSTYNDFILNKKEK